MRWKLGELLYEMEHDPARRILFVEGLRDVAFWRVFREDKGSNSAVYPIDVLECEGGEGGERGRLLRSARLFLGTQAADRVRFFADADIDRILQRVVPPNVFLTDGRDLEGYSFRVECLRHFCITCFPHTQETPEGLLEQIGRVARPIGVLRVMSARHQIGFPFQRSLSGQLRRYLKVVDGRLELDVDYLLRVLVQNSVGLSRLVDTMILYQTEVRVLQGVPDSELVHGKDFAELLSYKFNVEFGEMERHLHMAIAMERQYLGGLDGVRRVCDWLK